MTERSISWQVLYAVVMSSLVWGLALAAAWFADRTGSSLGYGPLPSGLAASDAYLSTLISVVLGGLAGGFMLVGVRQGRYVTRRFAWVLYFLVALPMALLLLTPMQRFGDEPFLGLPDFLMGAPGRMVLAVAMGALVIGAIDLRRLFPGMVNEQVVRAQQQTRVTPTSVRGLPGRFTPPAWRALSAMQEEAQRFDHAYVGTEHLLLGMLRDTRSHAVRIIVNLRSDPASMRRELEGSINRRGSLAPGGTGITRRCQQVIEQAARLSRAAGERSVNSGHLLQAMAESPEDVAGQLLENAGLSTERIAGELRQLGPEGE